MDALVPVLSPVMRVCMRGHQPTSLLAARVSRAIGVPVRRWLGMARTVRPQLGLSAGEREANVRGAFAARRATRVAGRTVCVVDDVTTTGATLREAARALRSAGAARVYGLVVSKMNLTTWDAGAGA
ncbi:MAG: phosphoribosyltransferase family protein [Phycisphaerae bacterium]